MSQMPQAANIPLLKIIGSGRNLNFTYVFLYDVWIYIFNFLHVYTVPEKLGSKKGKLLFFFQVQEALLKISWDLEKIRT